MSYSELLSSFDRESFQDNPEVFIQQYFLWSELAVEIQQNSALLAGIALYSPNRTDLIKER